MIHHMTTDFGRGTANQVVVNMTSGGVAVNYSTLLFYTELNTNIFSESNHISISVSIRLFQNNMSGLIWRLQVYGIGDMQVCVSHRFSFTTHIFIPLTGSTVESGSMLDYGWLWLTDGVGGCYYRTCRLHGDQKMEWMIRFWYCITKR